MSRADERAIDFRVGPDEAGKALGTVLRDKTGAPWSSAKKTIASGKVFVDGAALTDPGARLHEGQHVTTRPNAPRADVAQGLPRDAILHLDAHLVVVNKPSGVSTVPYDEGERGTLVDRVRVALHKRHEAASNAPLFVVHRLDKETSGVMVFARSWLAKRHLAALFREHTIDREYLALVSGRFAQARVTYDTHLVENRGDGLRGSAKQRGLGVRAVTHVERVAEISPTVSLVRCKLETGRTHQIRIHLAEAGHPILGERVYSRHWAGPSLEAPRTMLHAAVLGFTHPEQTDEALRWVVQAPPDFADFARSLGASESALRVD